MDPTDPLVHFTGGTDEVGIYPITGVTRFKGNNCRMYVRDPKSEDPSTRLQAQRVCNIEATAYFKAINCDSTIHTFGILGPTGHYDNHPCTCDGSNYFTSI
jgi:hypothetical protein